MRSRDSGVRSEAAEVLARALYRTCVPPTVAATTPLRWREHLARYQDGLRKADLPD